MFDKCLHPGSNLQAISTLYRIVKRSVCSHLECFFRSSFCSAPLLKVERSVSDRFLKPSESSLNTFIGAELQRNLVLVNDLFKSKGSVTNCITDRASVHTGNALEQFLHRNRILIPVHTVLEQLLKWSKKLPGTV